MMMKPYWLLAVACLFVSTTSHAARKPVKPLEEVPQVELLGSDRNNSSLRLVTRAHTGKANAARTGLFALGAVLGTGGQVSFGGKNSVRGDLIEDVTNPLMVTLPNLMKASLDIYASDYPDMIPPATFELTLGEWVLMYQKAGDTEILYELRFSAGLSSQPARLQKKRPRAVETFCQPEVQVNTLDAWQADDYAEVRRVAGEYISYCADEFATIFPSVFQPNPNQPAVELVAADEVAIEESIVEQGVTVDQEVVEPPVTEELLAEQPEADQEVVEQPVTETSVMTEQPITEESAAEPVAE